MILIPFVFGLFLFNVGNSVSGRKLTGDRDFVGPILDAYSNFENVSCANIVCIAPKKINPFIVSESGQCQCSEASKLLFLLVQKEKKFASSVELSEVSLQLLTIFNATSNQVIVQTENKSDKGSFLILVDFFPKEVEWSVQELRLLANLNSFSPFHFPFGDLSLISNSSEFHAVRSVNVKNHEGWKMMLAIVLIYVLLSLLLLCGMVVLLRWKLVGKTIDKEQPRKALLVNGKAVRCFSELEDEQKHKLQNISLERILHMTENFNGKKIVSQGRSSLVYKAIVVHDIRDLSITEESEKYWAIERMDKAMTSDDFANEVEGIATCCEHEHLLQLKGFCDEEEENILVFQFPEKGTLRSLLDANQLSFDQRLNIALGTAQGLEYLHNSARIKISHGNVKSENVFIDENYQAKVGCFGLIEQKLLQRQVILSSRSKTVLGCLSPELFNGNYANIKEDVYSFGVLLLEIFTGRGTVLGEFSVGGENIIITLVGWAFPYLQKGRFYSILDTQIEKQCSKSDADNLAEIILSCLRTKSCLRPEITEISWRLSDVQNLRFTKTISRDSLSTCAQSNEDEINSVLWSIPKSYGFGEVPETEIDSPTESERHGNCNSFTLSMDSSDREDLENESSISNTPCDEQDMLYKYSMTMPR